MGKTTKIVAIEFEFETEDPKQENPYIKSWWLSRNVLTALEGNLESINNSISNVNVNLVNVKVLPPSLEVDTVNIIKNN